jgi:hypothetical protein
MARSVIDVESEHVLLTLARLEVLISPLGLQVFLDTEVDPYIRARVEARFWAEGDDAVGRWAPLKPATEQFRREMGFPPSHPINVRTGDLMDYITQADPSIVPMGSGAIFNFPDSLPTDSEVDLAYRTAQLGRSDPSTVPRPVLGLGRKDAEEITILLMFYIEQGMTSLGRFAGV